MKINKNKAFTLVELLVVISIIGVLSSTIFATLNSSKAKARDAIRKSDLIQISKALDINYEKNNLYTSPEICGSDTSIGATLCNINNATNDWDSGSDLRDLITDGLMASLPKDPINNGSYHYVYEVWNANEDAPGLPGSGSGKPAGWATRICANMLESTGLSYCIFKN
jgi:prepilin-type N-terminal cleavage/methylation domain-containing protein